MLEVWTDHRVSKPYKPGSRYAVHGCLSHWPNMQQNVFVNDVQPTEQCTVCMH